MKITNGSVTYERTIRPADFENKRAIVNLSFNVDDEEPSAVIDEVGELARHHALNMLGIADGGNEVAVERAAEPAVPPTRPRRTRAIVPAASSGAPIEVFPVSTEILSSSPSDDANAKIAADNNAALAALGIVSPIEVEITDVTLGEAITHKAQAAGAVKVRDLIWTFVAAPATWHEIPQDKRQAFLDQLKVLS